MPPSKQEFIQFITDSKATVNTITRPDNMEIVEAVFNNGVIKYLPSEDGEIIIYKSDKKARLDMRGVLKKIDNPHLIIEQTDGFTVQKDIWEFR